MQGLGHRSDASTELADQRKTLADREGLDSCRREQAGSSLPSAPPDDPRIGGCGCIRRLPMRRDGRQVRHHQCHNGDGPGEIAPSARCLAVRIGGETCHSDQSRRRPRRAHHGRSRSMRRSSKPEIMPTKRVRRLWSTGIPGGSRSGGAPAVAPKVKGRF
jgi:hypothetical protein